MVLVYGCVIVWLCAYGPVCLCTFVPRIAASHCPALQWLPAASLWPELALSESGPTARDSWGQRCKTRTSRPEQAVKPRIETDWFGSENI